MGLFGGSDHGVRRVADPRHAVPRDNRSLMQKRGWKPGKSGGFDGPYAPKDLGTWHGHIKRSGDVFRVYIWKPPAAFLTHWKSACFHKTPDNDWWSIHLAKNPADGSVDAIILYVERLLTEALQGRKP